MYLEGIIFLKMLKKILQLLWLDRSNPFNIDSNKTITNRQNAIDKKILNTFRILEKTFTQKSDPVMLDENAKKLTMKEIHDKESIEDQPVTMIAVTRHQYSMDNFPKYVDYVKNKVGINKIYYGLWTDGKKVEYDVLYAIHTDDYDEIQKHLNAHNDMNNGITQKMALIIYPDGTSKPVNNKIDE